MANNTGKNILNGLFIAAISAGAALLLAPKPGEETRKDLKREAKKYGEKGQELANNLQDDIRKAVSEIDQDSRYDKTSITDVIKQQNDEMTAELEDLETNQQMAYTQEGEVTAVDAPSGDISGTSYETGADTVRSDKETVTTDDGAVSSVERPSGNVTGSVHDTTRDQVVPADQLDEALEDNK